MSRREAVPAPAVERRDVLIAGGGPSGATAAATLARRGFDVLVAERVRFPRFHVGESLLPANMPLFRELGLTERLFEIPHRRKTAVEFVDGVDDRTARRFVFRNGFRGDEPETVNVERASLDALLLDAARESGATIETGAGVRSIVRLDESGVVAHVGNRVVEARHLVDATGQACLVGKHLGTRRVLADHRKVAYFAHYRGVREPDDGGPGNPSMVMLADAWFWVIPIDRERTSIGMVVDRELARRIASEHGVSADEMLAWGIERCPTVRGRTAGAEAPAKNGVIADFSYRCRPYAGPGFFLVGDSAVFVDPIFSTGVCLGMRAAIEAADAIERVERRRASASRERRRYDAWLTRTSRPFFGLVRAYYDPAFRDMMFEGSGPLGVHRAIVSTLGGNVFPRMPVRTRWRLAFFHAMRRLQHRLELVPRRPLESLLDTRSGTVRSATRNPREPVSAAS